MNTYLPKYDAWMKRTHNTFRKRSSELKAIDSALQSYELLFKGQKTLVGHPSRIHVEGAFEAWKKAKGPGQKWRRSVRNKDYVIDELNMALTGQTYDVSVGPKEALGMDNARQGILYLFSSMRVESNLFNVVLDGGLSVAGSALSFMGTPEGGSNTSASSAGKNLGTALIPGKAILQATEKAAYVAESSGGQTLARRVREWLEDLAKKILASLEDKFGKIDLSLSALKNLLKILAGIFLKEAAPLINAGMDLAKGLANATTVAIDGIKSLSRGRGVEILEGHPTVIVNAIKNAIALSFCDGMYAALKGAGKMVLTGATAGAGLIANVVVAIIETLVKVIWRMVEILKMDTFFSEAAELWKENHPEMRMRPIVFNEWFKKSAQRLPALSILTLNSNICGDKMRFLQMYPTSGLVIAQSNTGTVLKNQQEFNRGVAYVDGLKDIGADYLKTTGYNFYSKDPVVSGLLANMKNYGVKRNVVWDGVLKVLNA